MPVLTITWRDGALDLIDQTRLPNELVHITCRDVETVAEAIEQLRVRGAPAIGIAAAYGVVVGAQLAADKQPDAFRASVLETIDRLAATRPTAVNLFWALERMRRVLDDSAHTTNGQMVDSLLAMGVTFAVIQLVSIGAAIAMLCHKDALDGAALNTKACLPEAAWALSSQLHPGAGRTGKRYVVVASCALEAPNAGETLRALARQHELLSVAA